MSKEIIDAINLLKDENLIWSADFDTIRLDLANVLLKAIQVEYHYLEPEISTIALKLVRDVERGTNVRRTETTEQTTTVQSSYNSGATFKRRSDDTSKCHCGCSKLADKDTI